MTPEELEKLPKPLERTMTALELSIMDEIIQRIKEAVQITPVTDWLLVRLDALGTGRSRIKRLIGEAIKEADLQVDDVYEQAAKSDYIRNKEIYEAAGKDYQNYEDNQWLQQVVDAARRQTKDSLRPLENITQTTGFNVPIGGGKKVFTPLSEYLERSLDKAMLGITTGARTYNQAIGGVIDEMTASGIRTVDYASGKSDRLEVAARRAVMTGVAQMARQVSARNAEELKTDYWEVDWHMGARNTGTGYQNHQSWQGKVYSTAEMHTICGEGEMLGFAGINCYHIKFPFLPGIMERKYTDEWLKEQDQKENKKNVYHGREYDTYGALQYQRRLERTIRKQKQDIELLKKAGADKDDIMTAKSRLRLTNKTYVDFSKEMGLPQQRERLRIAKELPKAKLGAGTSEGDAPGKPQLLGQIDPKDTDTAIKYYNEQIRNEDVEHSFVIDRKGNVYYSVGDNDSVSLDGIDLKDATITHNHPTSNGIVSFGKDDFEFLQAHVDLRQLTAVNEQYTYTARAIKNLSKVSYFDYYRKALEEADLFDPDFDIQHKVFEILDREGFVKYVRKAFNSKTGSGDNND